MPFHTVSISMAQNEADLIEYFVRANGNLIDHFIIILNPSNDGTAEILNALMAEGLPITVWPTERNVYRQGAIYSWLLRYVRDKIDPDFILLIDCDEILLCKNRENFLQ
nr:glycosyltransferase family 2 protein [uncultured Roseococcus sp.]